ncbi:hypothetical protein BpHYR1_022907 [Brachionus plicatilis]|uniref:Uncharacterized protein n=1 Tax=Brachionus plicatilis TaxID=10195 RepID=A0A3M7SBJ8_BRAPC|nr:hypothetical protein BpHYR1_022907 [Brachionus plicatilis]
MNKIKLNGLNLKKKEKISEIFRKPFFCIFISTSFRFIDKLVLFLNSSFNANKCAQYPNLPLIFVLNAFILRRNHFVLSDMFQSRYDMFLKCFYFKILKLKYISAQQTCAKKLKDKYFNDD